MLLLEEFRKVCRAERIVRPRRQNTAYRLRRCGFNGNDVALCGVGLSLRRGALQFPAARAGERRGRGAGCGTGAALRRGLFNRRFDTQGEMERTGESMEMAARRLRYTWFRSLCDEHGYNVIAIAHHINDSIETFFINMLRGTGLRGLTGISVQAGRIVRPLMFATRKDILDYATAHRIPYREDSSNRSTKYLRNKVRLGIVPMLREINPQFTTVMRRNISRLTDAQTFIDRSVELIRRDAMTEQGGLYTLHVDRIDASLPLGYVVYEILNSMFGFKGDTVDALCHALQQNNTGRRFYSREWVATIDRGRIVIGRIADEDTCMTQVEQGVLRSYCGSSGAPLRVLRHRHDRLRDHARQRGSGRCRQTPVPAYAAALAAG